MPKERNKKLKSWPSFNHTLDHINELLKIWIHPWLSQRDQDKTKLVFKGGDVAQVVQHRTGIPLTQVPFPGVVRNVLPQSTFSADSLTCDHTPPCAHAKDPVIHVKDRRTVQMTAALTRLKPVWNDRSSSLSSKIRPMRSLVTSIFMYAYESRTLTAKLQRRIRAIEMKRHHKIQCISCKDHVTNEKVCAKIQQAIRPQKDLLTIVKRCKLKW